ncbi:isochorismatase family protein [Dactylosporangium sp. NPDC000244]|uniref:isochorismatase family protein n=1 Tax=Dactylosporangium sp. NPDC000244 TaxID=3154365 RepID=UPI00331DE01A
MTVTVLDPKTALIVVDLQTSSLRANTVHPMAEVVSKAGRLANGFRRSGLPVVLVNVGGVSPGRNERPRRVHRSRGAEDLQFAAGLDQQSSDHVVTKYTWSAFTATDLAVYLAAHEVTQVVLAGVATSAGVESTARRAHELGLNVTLAVDAMTDLDADAHANSLRWIFPRLGESGTTDDILTLLPPCA